MGQIWEGKVSPLPLSDVIYRAKGYHFCIYFCNALSMRMHAFYSVLTNKLVFLLVIRRCLTCLVSGMNT